MSPHLPPHLSRVRTVVLEAVRHPQKWHIPTKLILCPENWAWPGWGVPKSGHTSLWAASCLRPDLAGQRCEPTSPTPMRPGSFHHAARPGLVGGLQPGSPSVVGNVSSAESQFPFEKNPRCMGLGEAEQPKGPDQGCSRVNARGPSAEPDP